MGCLAVGRGWGIFMIVIRGNDWSFLCWPGKYLSINSVYFDAVWCTSGKISHTLD